MKNAIKCLRKNNFKPKEIKEMVSRAREVSKDKGISDHEAILSIVKAKVSEAQTEYDSVVSVLKKNYKGPEKFEKPAATIKPEKPGLYTKDKFIERLKSVGVAQHEGITYKVMRDKPGSTYYLQITESGVRETLGPGAPAQWSIGETIDRALTSAGLKQIEEPATPEKKTEPKKEQTPTVKLASWVTEMISSGKQYTWRDLFRQADDAFGGTQTDGKYTSRDAYEAQELGVNLWVKVAVKGIASASEAIRYLKATMAGIVTQTKRTKDQIDLQQFSTPPSHSYLAAWVASIGRNDVVLEPSAGVGSLVAAAQSQNPKEVVANEISDRRADILENFGIKVYRENAAHLNAILPENVKPTVVLMNPPFSADVNMKGTKMDTKVGADHIEEGLKRLEEGGRLVAIAGRGMAMDKPTFKKWWAGITSKYNVKAVIPISGKEYVKYGTNFDNVLIVIDKTGKTSSLENIVTESVEAVEDAVPLLEDVYNARQREQGKPGTDQLTGKKGASGTRSEPVKLGATLPEADGVGAVPGGAIVQPEQPSGAEGAGGVPSDAGTGGSPGVPELSGGGGRGSSLSTGGTGEAGAEGAGGVPGERSAPPDDSKQHRIPDEGDRTADVEFEASEQKEKEGEKGPAFESSFDSTSLEKLKSKTPLLLRRQIASNVVSIGNEISSHIGNDATNSLIREGKIRFIDGKAATAKFGRTVETAKAFIVTYSDGSSTVYMIPGRIKKGHAWSVLLHELGVHYGYKKIFGEKLSQYIFANFAAKRYENSDLGRAIARAYAVVPSSTPRENVNEEALAYFVEARGNRKLEWHRKLIAATKAWLVKHLGVSPGRFTEEDYIALASSAIGKTARNLKATSISIKDSDLKLSEGIPDFRSAREAADFGKIATPEEIEQIDKMRHSVLMESEVQKKKGNHAEALDLSFRSQFLREAIESYHGIIRGGPPQLPAHLKLSDEQDLSAWAAALVEQTLKGTGASLTTENIEGIKVAKKVFESPISPEGFDLPIEGSVRQAFNLIQFKIQDRFNSLKIVQDAIVLPPHVELEDDENTYQTEELYHDQVARRVEEFDANVIDPLTEDIVKTGIGLENLERYLYARHAREANARFMALNPKREDNEALSGMTDEEADGILNEYEGNEAMEILAKKVDDVVGSTRDLLVAEGLATPEEIEAWSSAYKFYVPLKREGKDAGMPKRGQGMNIAGPESKRRLTGSSQRRAVNILTNILAQHEASIIRAEKAKIGRAMLKFASKHKSSMWEVDAPELKPLLSKRSWRSRGKRPEGYPEQTRVFDGKVDPMTGLPSSLGEVVYGKDRAYKFKDNVLVVKVDGVEHTITFDEQNVHAQRIAIGLKNLGSGSGNAIINIMSKINRYLAIVNTAASPEFILNNFLKDLQTAGYNINDTQAEKIRGRIFKDVFKALAGIRKGIRGKYDTEWSQDYKDFREHGGQTGWMEYYKDTESREKALKKKLSLLGSGPGVSARKIIKSAFTLISRENVAVENAIRLSTYKHLVKAGISKEKAASAAKNLTVNFNRRGDVGQALGAFYLFFGANIQGSARLIMAAKRNKKVRAMMYGTVGFAVMLDILNRTLGGDDDDGEKKYDKIPSWIKERNLILMRPNGDYFKICPLPWGYNTLHVLGQVIGEAVDPNKKEFSAIGAAGKLASAVISSFNPVGGEGSILQFIAPTILDPFVQWKENKNFAGAPLKPEQMPFDVPKPEYQMHWKSVRGLSKVISKELNDLTGGDEVVPGKIDISPEIIDLFVDTFTGGAGKFMGNVLELPATLSKKDVKVSKIPFARRLYGEKSEFYTRTKFYDNLNEIRYAEKSEKHFAQIKDIEKLSSVRTKYSWQLRFRDRVKLDRKEIRRLRGRRNEVEANKALAKESKEKTVDAINEGIRTRMSNFNLLYGSKGRQ